VTRGEVLVFLRGEEGAHQLLNRSDETVRFLSLSTSEALDIVAYPHSNKIACHERGGLRELHFRANAVDYWDGESPPD
jgi:uncharacterized cupin superfamily protein